MKQIRILFYLAIFCLALISSRQISLSIFHPQIEVNPISSRWEPLDIENPPLSGQVNILFFHINNLEEQKLISSWWIAIAPQSPITMVSLFPAEQHDDPLAHLLEKNFSIIQNSSANLEVSPILLSQIRQRLIPWDGYIVVDHRALSVLIDYLGGVKLDGDQLDGSSVISLLNQTEGDPALAYGLQNELWESLCWKSIFASSPNGFELIRPELQNHSIISSQFPLTLTDFQAFNTRTYKLTCTINPRSKELEETTPDPIIESSQENH